MAQENNHTEALHTELEKASSALAAEIAAFLSGHGVECTITLDGGHGLPVIRTGPGPAVIPLGICAMNMEDASECRRIAVDAAGIKETAARPIIISADRWTSEGDCIRKRLLAHLGQFRHVFARNCEVRKIRRDQAAEFMDAFHSYGSTVCRYAYGLFLKKAADSPEGQIPAGTLVAAATFSNGRLMERDGKKWRSYQWIRYASLPDVRVTGGMGKLLKHFMSDTGMGDNGTADAASPGFGGWDIMSYADIEWSAGNVYRRLGFTGEGFKSPVMYCIGTDGWKRKPVSRMGGEGWQDKAALEKKFFFENFGSIRYRLVIPLQPSSGH